MGELPLEPGDTLLIQGGKKSIKALRTKSDLLPMDVTTSKYKIKYCKNFNFYFFKCCSPRSIRDTPTCCCFINCVVVSMISSKVLSVRQALRSVDNNLLLLIVTSCALQGYSGDWSC